MKKVLLTLVAALFVLVAAAQSENAIIIDSKSFRPIQTDALTGVNIDPIQLDSSRRPCARIKVRINRMSKEDINGIEVKIITNNQLTKCRTAEYDNGLIVEMTAKPETRFYFYHPRLGYSNEVSVNLESNKEYRLDAYQNQQLSISVVSDVAGADVYLDEIYRGQTNVDKSFVIHNVTPGEHKLIVEYADKRAEQTIYASGSKLSFVLNVLTVATNNDIIAKTSDEGYHYKVVTRKVRHLSDRRGGFEHSITMGNQPSWRNYSDDSFGYFPLRADYIAGYRTKSNVFFGAGIGIEVGLGYYLARELAIQGNAQFFTALNYIDGGLMRTSFNQILPLSKVRVPIFAHLRYYMTNTRWQPFIAISLGSSIGKQQSIDVYDIVEPNYDNGYEELGKNLLNTLTYSTTGVFVEPMFGLDFRMVEKCSINLQIGGVFQTLPCLYEKNGIGAVKQRIQCGLSGKIGFTF